MRGQKATPKDGVAELNSFDERFNPSVRATLYRVRGGVDWCAGRIHFVDLSIKPTKHLMAKFVAILPHL